MTDEVKRCNEALRFKEDFEYIECPIPAGNCEENCMLDVAADLIESLAAELEQVKRERNAAIQDFELVSISLCRTCKNYRKPTAKRRKGSCVELPDASVTCVGSCSWFEWRGVKEDVE